MMGSYICGSVFMAIIPICVLTPTPLNDLNINLNFNEFPPKGYEEDVIVVSGNIINTRNYSTDVKDYTNTGTVVQGCNGMADGIPCCEEDFVVGDNKGRTEWFIEADEFTISCEYSCKTLYPRSNGISESLHEAYTSGPGKHKNKCWCEFGKPKLNTKNKGYRTCVFNCKEMADGIPCCTKNFIVGDNEGITEEFIQADNYITSCTHTCKRLYPSSVGITERVNDQYNTGPGKNKNKCWCEFGYPQLNTKKEEFKTCIFKTCSSAWLQQNQGIRPKDKTKKNRIVGGPRVKDWKRWPWVASLKIRDLDPDVFFKCGGVLISCEHIVTALHCLDDYDEQKDKLQIVTPDRVSISLGSTRYMGGIAKFKGRVIYYQDTGYRENSEVPKDDIAVIQMDGKIDPFTKIRPILLPTYDMPILPNNVDPDQRSTKFWLAGWGDTPKNTIKLRQTNKLKMMHGRVCKNYDPFYATSTSICVKSFLTLEPLAAGCDGDSGSPGMTKYPSDKKWHLQGIYRTLYGNCTENRAGILGAFTNVFHYKNDIEEIIEGSLPTNLPPGWSNIIKL